MSKGVLEKWFPMLMSALVLSAFAVIGSTLVGLAWEGTAEQIEQNERDALLSQMGEILPPQSYTNDLLADTTEILAPEALGGTTTTVYRARKDGGDVAAIFSPVTTPGYAGDIVLIVGVKADGTVAGVRVIRHKETPGLGDKIEVKRTPWILGFAGKKLGNPPEARWGVKRDGGEFDQFTGATITPRTVVAAVRRTLHYFRDHREQVFGYPDQKPPVAGDSQDKAATHG